MYGAVADATRRAGRGVGSLKLSIYHYQWRLRNFSAMKIEGPRKGWGRDAANLLHRVGKRKNVMMNMRTRDCT